MVNYIRINNEKGIDRLRNVIKDIDILCINFEINNFKLFQNI